MRWLIILSARVALATLVITAPAFATNYPCSKSKGGVDRCQGSKFVCRDGSISSSKRKCTPASAAAFRSEWERDNGSADDSAPEDSGTEAPKGEQPQGLFFTPLKILPTASTSHPARVIDGDTLEVGGETFRLEGIDAPEMKQTCSDASGLSYPCGRRAKETLGAMAADLVACEKTGEDKYGRSLGYCSAAGVELNRQMVAQGWALAFVKYSTRYVADEAEARGAKRGIWAGTVQAPWDWRAAQIAELAPKGDCVIKGNISDGRKTYYLPFHLSYARVKVDESAGERWFCSEEEALSVGWRRAAR